MAPAVVELANKYFMNSDAKAECHTLKTDDSTPRVWLHPFLEHRLSQNEACTVAALTDRICHLETKICLVEKGDEENRSRQLDSQGDEQKLR